MKFHEYLTPDNDRPYIIATRFNDDGSPVIFGVQSDEQGKVLAVAVPHVDFPFYTVLMDRDAYGGDDDMFNEIMSGLKAELADIEIPEWTALGKSNARKREGMQA